MQILFKIKAHFGYNSYQSEIYYVIAKDSTSAEEMVVNYHKMNDYRSIDFCHSETIAQAKEYGKPSILLV